MPLKTAFRPSFGNRPQPLVGREETIEKIIGALDNPPGDRERATLVTGQRGMGKTALLLELEEQARKKNFIVARVSASEAMNEEIIECIQLNGASYINEKKKHLKGVSAGAFGFSLGLTFSDDISEKFGFRSKLSLLADALEKNDLGILILVDEVLPDSPQMRQLATTFQHLIGEGKNIAIVMAGLPSSISAILSDNILTFLNRATHISLGPLSLGSVAVSYRKALEDANKQTSETLLQEAARSTRGFPYLFQLVGYYLLQFGENKATLDNKVLADALASAKADLVTNVYEAALRELSAKDKEFLFAMATDAEPSNIEDIQKRLGVSNGYVQTYRQRLLSTGIIASPGRGQLEFTLPYMDEYLRDYKKGL